MGAGQGQEVLQVVGRFQGADPGEGDQGEHGREQHQPARRGRASRAATRRGTGPAPEKTAPSAAGTPRRGRFAFAASAARPIVCATRRRSPTTLAARSSAQRSTVYSTARAAGRSSGLAVAASRAAVVNR